MTDYEIRPALIREADLLTGLSLASKRYWDYPESYFDIWLGELTITPASIESCDVFVYREENTISGYYSLTTLESDMPFKGMVLPAGTWLEHMFVAPERIGQGIGSRLFSHMCTVAEEKEIASIGILADPHALGFYRRMGCTYIGEFPSSIEGRTTPYVRWKR